LSPISSTQQGIIAQQEFAKLVVLGSDGQLEVAWSLTDDERRDVEVHAQGQNPDAPSSQEKGTRSEWCTHAPGRRPVGIATLMG
jgi:hypothetical protein